MRMPESAFDVTYTSTIMWSSSSSMFVRRPIHLQACCPRSRIIGQTLASSVIAAETAKLFNSFNTIDVIP